MLTETDDRPDDEIVCLEPIAYKRFIGEDISEVKWAFNDSFLVVVTCTNKLFLLDSLCHSYNLILPHQTDTSSRQKVLKLKPSKSIGTAMTAEQASDLFLPFSVKGTGAQINSMGLPMVTSSKYLVLQASAIGQEALPTFLKILYLDTSPSMFLKGNLKGSSSIIDD